MDDQNVKPVEVDVDIPKSESDALTGKGADPMVKPVSNPMPEPPPSGTPDV